MKTAVGIAAALALAGQAHAITAFSIGSIGGADPGFAPNESSVVSFDGPSAAGVAETDNGPGGSVALFTSTVVDLAAAPVGDTTRFQAIQPGGVAKFDFTHYAPGVGSLSVYVGSIDSYNMFVIGTNSKNYFYNGNGFQHHDGDEVSHLTNRRVYFQFSPSEIFRSITFSSGGIAFEYDSLAAQSYPGASPPWSPTGPDVQVLLWSRESDVSSPVSVPEPATWAFMLTGLASVGGMLRRRRVRTA